MEGQGDGMMGKWKTTGIMVFCMVLLLTGCGSAAGEEGTKGETAYRSDASVQELRDAAVEALGENYWPDFALGEQELEDMTGLKADQYEEFSAEMPMISVNVDTMIIVKAKEGKTGEVEEALTAYRQRLVDDTMQYPMNLGKIQASQVVTFGNYVCFLQLGADTAEASESGDEAVIKQCQEENRKAADAIEASLKE